MSSADPHSPHESPHPEWASYPHPPAAPEPRIIVADVSSVGWPQPLDQARDFGVDRVERLVAEIDSGGLRLLFDDARDACREVAIVSDPCAVPDPLWVIGDLHGDLLAMAHAWAYISARSRDKDTPSTAVFLGDFVDRGPYSPEVLLWLFRLLRDHPGRVAVLPGNHDVSFAWDGGISQFVSEIGQADYVGRINSRLGAGTYEPDGAGVRLARAAATFFATRPRAIILPNGTLLAHAGFPHVDEQDELHAPADLGRPLCQQDFVWLRLSENSPRKRPNRSSKGCDFGYADFARFCELSEGLLGVRVRGMLRGHEHPPDRYQYYPRYQEQGTPILTLNTICRRLPDETPGRVRDVMPASVVRLSREGPPEIHRLRIAENEVLSAYREELLPPSEDTN